MYPLHFVAAPDKLNPSIRHPAVWFTKMENQVQVNLYQLLALFVPNSAGDSKALLRLTLQAVSQTFPLLSHLLGVVGRAKLSPVRIEQLFTDAQGKAAADVLKLLFNKFGSDKSTAHNYHHLYGEILKNRDDISYVLEIGLGTNNLDVVSNMGTQGKPGASLRRLSRVSAERNNIWCRHRQKNPVSR